MIYNNLIYLLVVVLILTTHTAPESPQLPLAAGLTIFLLKGVSYLVFCLRAFSTRRIQQASRYFSAEQKLSILAIGSMAIDVYLLDCQYYFTRLPFADRLPVLAELGGMALFFCYLALLWTTARKSYQHIFGRRHTVRSFLATNLKINLAIILPWLLLSLTSDLLQISSSPVIKKILASPWGEPGLLIIFFLFLATGFPVIVTRLWNCAPLPAGPVRSRIEAFCARERLGYADILLWPLFEGQVLTAAVMGISRRFRYLLITPALLQSMTTEEVEAVMAHEIGHVKKFHLQLYLVLFLGFGLLAQLSSYPVIYLLLASDFFYQLTRVSGQSPGDMLALLSTLPMILLIVLYFRFVFGFFMRNFERQADIHAFETMGSSAPLIRVFEKIAWLSGKIRDLPSWHHFGIGQRIDFLLKCQAGRKAIRRHNQKVYAALLLYLAAMAGAGWLLWKMPADLLEGAPRARFAEAVLEQKIREDPHNARWLQFLGDLRYSRKEYGAAIKTYENVLEIEPENAEVLNNLAWLLLTAEDKDLRDPARALDLARQAAAARPDGHILDTLATAYWANRMIPRAITVEKQAMAADPDNADYYRRQLEKFMVVPPGQAD